jgi:hypothetical protein
MEISGKALLGASEKTGRKDRRNEAEEIEEIKEVKEQTKRHPTARSAARGSSRRFGDGLLGVLKSGREKTNC